MGFLFDPTTAADPASIELKRQLARALAGQIGNAQTIGGGIGDLFKSPAPEVLQTVEDGSVVFLLGEQLVINGEGLAE